MLQIISQYPIISYKELKERSGLGKASFTYNLKRLKKMKLIWRVKKKDKIGYDILTKEKLADEMYLLVVNKYLEGEVDKDTMMELIEKLKDYGRSKSKYCSSLLDR